ncbi:hypothetical protein Nepgr_009625 [Nepenthes gracilis]|uniref:Uncharacterized protein n=1 Tax=Nepenthes gracilis TaxID=150966 RepID=A0AAD3XKI9_NEPGR|nr:hypothetical protein Nepgr_009625 [Nepenthes gracilis]
MGNNDVSATLAPASPGLRVDGSKFEPEASPTGPWDGNGNDAKKISVNPQNDSGPVTQTKPPALPPASPSTTPHSTMPTTSQMAPNTTHKLPENQGGVVVGYIVLPTDLTQYGEMTKPLEESKAAELTGARTTVAMSTVPYGIQYPSNDQKKSAEPQKPTQGNPSSAVTGVTAQSGSNGCGCCSIL